MRKQLTGAQAGLSGDEQVRIALRTIVDNGGTIDVPTVYAALEKHMGGAQLSKQGKDSLRSFVYRAAVKAGLIYPPDPKSPGWRITPKGREFIESEPLPEEDAVNVDTGQTVKIPSNSASGAAFESYILELLKRMYPDYAWYHQGVHKSTERGLDFIGNLIGSSQNKPQSIGVQVKFHAKNTRPSQAEWLKFLAGCFTRRVNRAIFVTTGSLDSEQRREAGEAEVLVIEGQEEVNRIAKEYGFERFDLYNFK